MNVNDALASQYSWIEDPGHSWLVVPLRDVRRLKFRPSQCSYYHGGFAFLEEDCDAPAFLVCRFGTLTGQTFPSVYVPEFTGQERYARFAGTSS